MKDLPDFVPRPYDQVKAFAEDVLTNHITPDESQLVVLWRFDDHSFRAVFEKDYFGTETPTKSQWNSLKKKLKRVDRNVFVFKEHGEIDLDTREAPTDDTSPDDICYFLDFGFLAPR